MMKSSNRADAKIKQTNFITFSSKFKGPQFCPLLTAWKKVFDKKTEIKNFYLQEKQLAVEEKND